LAPLLFLAFVNDLPRHIPSYAHVCQYADDTAIWLTSRNEVKLEKDAQLVLDALSSYCKDWRISMNPSKSSYLYVPRSLSRDTYNFRLWMNGDLIPAASTCKFLGITFHKHLRWSPHVQLLRQKAVRKLNCLKLLSRVNGCEPNVIMRLYKAYIRPVLTYGFAAWANVPDSILDTLARIERAAIKFAYRIPRHYPSDYIYRVSGLTPLDVYASDLALSFYEKDTCPEDVHEYLTTYDRKHKGRRRAFRAEYPIFSIRRRIASWEDYIANTLDDLPNDSTTQPCSPQPSPIL
jgi:hypothetical protein